MTGMTPFKLRQENLKPHKPKMSRDEKQIILLCGIWFNAFMLMPGENRNNLTDLVEAFVFATIITVIVGAIMLHFWPSQVKEK